MRESVLSVLFRGPKRVEFVFRRLAEARLITDSSSSVENERPMEREILSSLLRDDVDDDEEKIPVLAGTLTGSKEDPQRSSKS